MNFIVTFQEEIFMIAIIWRFVNYYVDSSSLNLVFNHKGLTLSTTLTTILEEQWSPVDKLNLIMLTQVAMV